jgi:molybdenum cofactor cytidylyltransferase
MAVAAILLCGGASRRFGANKLLAGEEPIAVLSARNLREGAGPVLAVLPPGDAALRAVLEAAGCAIIETDRTARGMGASLAAAVESSARADGWIVALGDMPLVRPGTIAAVKSALERGAVLAAPCDSRGQRGHPVGFSAALRDELLALDGDVGARDLVSRHAGRLKRIETDDRGIFIDIDTPADLRELQQ